MIYRRRCARANRTGEGIIHNMETRAKLRQIPQRPVRVPAIGSMREYC